MEWYFIESRAKSEWIDSVVSYICLFAARQVMKLMEERRVSQKDVETAE